MRKQVLIVTLAVSALGLINAIWLTYVRRAYGSSVRSSAFYPLYSEVRSILLNPISIISFAICFSFWFLLTWRRLRRRQIPRLNELLALGMMEAMLGGLILIACFRLWRVARTYSARTILGAPSSVGYSLRAPIREQNKFFIRALASNGGLATQSLYSQLKFDNGMLGA
jgi:hypothetical protein